MVFGDCTNCTVLNLKENFWQEKRKSQKKKVGDYFLAYIMSAPSLICLAFFFSSFTSRENQMCFLNSVDAAGLISRSFLESPTTNLDYWTHPSSPHPRETLWRMWPEWCPLCVLSLLFSIWTVLSETATTKYFNGKHILKCHKLCIF